MHVCIVYHKTIPVKKYGGIQRIVWWLGKELVNQGHKVTYLVGEGSTCPFAEVKYINPEEDLNDQIPREVDVVHSYVPIMEIDKPYLLHMESNTTDAEHHINTVFVSKKHAERHNAQCYVYNGLDPDDYGQPDFTRKKNYLHFLGKAAWRVKNIKGAIRIAQKSKNHLHVLGGKRLNLHMGFRLTLDPRIHFHGMIGGEAKNKIINDSKGLLFPVIWHEPFGIAITESMYFGCPVFATPYGSLPELVNEESGFLSNKSDELIDVLSQPLDYDAQKIHERVMDCFSVKQMVEEFLKLYEKVINGDSLNKSKPIFPEGEPKFLPFE
ncbi:MAG: glycosyltransferase [Fulvivirga sp.]|nr:glycosyltransferase [Fulvivirga sp.]